MCPTIYLNPILNKLVPEIKNYKYFFHVRNTMTIMNLRTQHRHQRLFSRVLCNFEAFYAVE